MPLCYIYREGEAASFPTDTPPPRKSAAPHALACSAGPGQRPWLPTLWAGALLSRAEEAPAVCQPSGASPPHSCPSSSPLLGCFAIYSPDVSVSQGGAKHIQPLVTNLQARLQGVAENRTGRRGCAQPQFRPSCEHPAVTAGDKGLNPFLVQTSVTLSRAPKASVTPGLSWAPWGGRTQSSGLGPAACFLGELSWGSGQCA